MARQRSFYWFLLFTCAVYQDNELTVRLSGLGFHFFFKMSAPHLPRQIFVLFWSIVAHAVKSSPRFKKQYDKVFCLFFLQRTQCILGAYKRVRINLRMHSWLRPKTPPEWYYVFLSYESSIRKTAIEHRWVPFSNVPDSRRRGPNLKFWDFS